MTRTVDRARSLEELERDCWPAPPADATRLAVTAHALRSKPIGELTIEDMRMLIRQDVGLPYLLPLALDVLRGNPLAEGDMYEGDLLSAVVTRSPAAWSELARLRHDLRVIVSELAAMPHVLRLDVERFLAAGR
ncbi:contact-dependent growth inhibition system immunity protein [Streptomyces sp. NPDC002889]|uniref:contact-dependent growth inhibition system immunity protein n=1 Tax=Streptomyces sp. NPDC002889 TaxID=3364669 RepID=UPI0036B1A252